jgi:hypothetical protein
VSKTELSRLKGNVCLGPVYDKNDRALDILFAEVFVQISHDLNIKILINEALWTD